MNTKRIAAALAALLAAVALSVPAQAQQSYRILDIGLMAGTNKCEPHAINDAGQIVGNTTRLASRQSQPYHGFLWESGTFYTLAPVGGRDRSNASGISNAGLVAGSSSYNSPAPSDQVAVLWRRTGGPGSAYSAIDLNTLLPADSGWTLTLAIGISPNGRYVVGQGIYALDGARHGFVAELAPDSSVIVRIQALGNLGGRLVTNNTISNGQVNAVNDAGQVTGSAYTGEMSGTSHVARAFRITPTDANADSIPDTWFTPKAGAPDLMTNALMEDLGTLGGDGSSGRLINAAGKVAGTAEHSDGYNRGFLWTPGGTDGVATNPQMRGVGLLSGTISYAMGLNDSDVVVGWASRNAGAHHAFVWDRTHGIWDLNDLKALGDAAYLELNHARGINSGGQIVGTATHWVKRNAGNPRAYLAIPVP